MCEQQVFRYLNPILLVCSTDSNNLNNASTVICSRTPGKESTLLQHAIELVYFDPKASEGTHSQKAAGSISMKTTLEHAGDKEQSSTVKIILWR